MKKQILLMLALVVGVSGNANAGIIHAGTPDADYRNYGNSSIFSSVVGVIGYNAAGAGFFLGSGVMVSDDYLLFTGHQANNGIALDITSYAVRTGVNLLSPNGIFTTNADVIFHPSYVTRGTGYDLALLKMNTPVAGVTPAELYGGDVSIGNPVSIAGYGATGVVGGTTTYDYNKRGYENVITNLGYPYWTPNYLGYSFEGLGSPNYLSLGGLLWNADSGGGWFIDDGGEWKLAAISASSLLINDYGAESYATTIDVNWVNSYVSPSAATPEPGSLVVLSLGFGIFALKKWKKRSTAC